VRRLTKDEGLSGARPGRQFKLTTISDENQHRSSDPVDRQFVAPDPNRLWIADLTCVKTFTGWVNVAFIIDVFSRAIVGWQISISPRSDLAIDALEMAIYARNGRDLSQVIRHSDMGVQGQYTSVSYTDRIDELGVSALIGTFGESYDCEPWPNQLWDTSRPNCTVTRWCWLTPEDTGRGSTTSRLRCVRGPLGSTTSLLTVSSMTARRPKPRRSIVTQIEPRRPEGTQRRSVLPEFPGRLCVLKGD
jgi:hypothetical protein